MPTFLWITRNKKVIVIFLVLFLIVSTILISTSVKKYALSLNEKGYHCSTLSKDDEKALKLNAEFIASIRKIREDSISYNEKINNCGTEKEYEYHPEVQKLIPPDIQASLDEYHRTKPYTIKDFQECRKYWEDAKREDYGRWTGEIKKWEDYEEKILTKNNCTPTQ